jgi:hypothetical protein
MPKSLKVTYHNKYKTRIHEMLVDKYESTHSGKSSTSYDLFGDLSSMIKMEIDHHLRYFKYVNGFIGYDYMILRHVGFDLLLYLMLEHENLTKRYYDIRCNELRIQFYLFLNCIYNLREKYEYFLGCKTDNANLSFKGSVLSITGVEAVRKCFLSAQKTIGKYCDSRNKIVHNSYFLEYQDPNIIFVKTISFNLRNIHSKLQKGSNNSFELSQDEILNVFDSLYKLRFNICNILSDLKNIDENKFLSNYKKNGIVEIGYP